MLRKFTILLFDTESLGNVSGFIFYKIEGMEMWFLKNIPAILSLWPNHLKVGVGLWEGGSVTLTTGQLTINPPLRGKSRNFLSGILLFPKNFRLRRAGSYFRLNFNTVFAFKSPKIVSLRRANFRRDLIFLKVSEKKSPGFIVGGGVLLIAR